MLILGTFCISNKGTEQSAKFGSNFRQSYLTVSQALCKLVWRFYLALFFYTCSLCVFRANIRKLHKTLKEQQQLTETRQVENFVVFNAGCLNLFRPLWFPLKRLNLAEK